jgi:arginine decarboxylase
MVDRFSAAEKTYFPDAWGGGYFTIGPKGTIQVDVNADGHQKVDLYELVQQLQAKGATPPYLFRFPQILEHRIETLHGAFLGAIKEFDYPGTYQGVFPMKVNHRKEVMEYILKAGRRFEYGIEVGSKPEMYVALALPLTPGGLLLCNGFKDDDYIRMAMNARRLGRNVVIILESLAEAHSVLKLADEMSLDVVLGIRVRLHARGSGRWEESGGAHSKFGLSTGELLEVVQLLEKNDRLDWLELLHFHVGSQITEIKRIKNAIKEAARVYSRLKKSVRSLQYLNVGGGLGVDYDGSKTSSDASINYTVQEYANDVVYQVLDVCQSENIPPPTLVSESGRAVTAHHSVMVVNVHRAPENVMDADKISVVSDDPAVLQELFDIRNDITRKNYREFYHDALDHRDELNSLFNLGFLELRDRARGEALFFDICHHAVRLAKRERGPMREEFDDLQRDLAYRYICNFSVFQSLPDAWAVGQLFPIMPIHRLGEKPDTGAILCDITCDSDGVIDNFVDMHDERRFLELHKTTPKELYWIGVFLVGAYQDILGDFHNLFGKVNEASVVVGEGGRPHIQKVLAGDTIRESLQFVRYDPNELAKNLGRELEKRVKDGKLTEREAERMTGDFLRGLEGTTYIIPAGKPPKRKR